MTSSISCRSAPEAMAIGTAPAAARTKSMAPGNSTEPAAEHRLELVPLARHQPGHARRVHRHAAVFAEGLEHADVVVAEIARRVLLRRQLEPVLGERLLEGAEVQRLAVGDHAVEVEDDRLQGGRHEPGAFSPARISTFSRLDGGGNGQS